MTINFYLEQPYLEVEDANENKLIRDQIADLKAKEARYGFNIRSTVIIIRPRLYQFIIAHQIRMNLLCMETGKSMLGK